MIKLKAVDLCRSSPTFPVPEFPERYVWRGFEFKAGWGAYHLAMGKGGASDWYFNKGWDTARKEYEHELKHRR